MLYSIFTICRRIRRELLHNLPVLLCLACSVYVLSSVFHLYTTLQTRYDALAAETDVGYLRFDVADDAIRRSTFTHERYAAADLPASVSLHTLALSGATVDGLPDTVALWCMPDAAFSDFFATERASDDAVYCSQAVYDAICAGSIRIFCQGVTVTLTETHITLGEQALPLCVLPPSAAALSSTLARDENPEKDLPLDRVLLLPASAGTALQNEPFLSYRIDAYYGGDDDFDTLLHTVYSAFPDVTLHRYDPLSFLRMQCETLSEILSLSAGIAVILLLLTLGGTVGMLYVRFLSRRYEIAVTLALGNTPDRVRFELLSEVALLLSSGTACGIGASHMTVTALASRLRFIPFAVEPSGAVIPLGVLFAFTVTGTVVSAVRIGCGTYRVTTIINTEEF